MHKDRAGARDLILAICAAEPTLPVNVGMVIAPPYPFLEMAVQLTRGTRVMVAAQNCHEAAHGAFTGEVSASMLASLEVRACIVGHSERRQYFGETDAAVGQKLAVLLAQGITPIYCCGERKEERLSGQHFDVVTEQMKGALGKLDNDQLQKVVIAYEPVWAIGTGRTATPDDASAVHSAIVAALKTAIGERALGIPILYGGSVNRGNATALLAAPDVDGVLVGGASLDADGWNAIVRA